MIENFDGILINCSGDTVECFFHILNSIFKGASTLFYRGHAVFQSVKSLFEFILYFLKTSLDSSQYIGKRWFICI